MMLPRQRSAAIAGAILWLSLVASCGSPASECGSDAECPTGERCVSAGGVLTSGGTCVAEHVLRDEVGIRDAEHNRPDATESDPDAEAPPDIDTFSADGTSDTTADGGGEPCETGETRTCYNGPDGTAGVGACARGTQTCRPDGTWGDCIGETVPASTKCDATDNDCDGAVDEGCQCNFANTATGVCSRGSRGESGDCSVPPESYESDESSCDTLDNDCDGVVDEECPCDFKGTVEGVCTNGVIDGSTGNCTAPSDYESDETSCDGLDNDCDGDVDEGVRTTYYRDRDGDGYGDADASKEACSKPSGYVSNQEDCYDDNADAYPGQSTGFEQDRGDGSFDYDCDGKQSKLLTETYQCTGNDSSSCALASAGWAGTAPDCGKTATWVTSCNWDDMIQFCTIGKTISKPQKCR